MCSHPFIICPSFLFSLTFFIDPFHGEILFMIEFTDFSHFLTKIFQCNNWLYIDYHYFAGLEEKKIFFLLNYIHGYVFNKQLPIIGGFYANFVIVLMMMHHHHHYYYYNILCRYKLIN